MARPIEHRAEFGFPAEQVYAALIDETYLRERLAAIGGRESELVSHTVEPGPDGGGGTGGGPDGGPAGGTVRAVMRQGIDAEFLPPVVKRITPNGVIIERTETWRAGTPYRGTIAAQVNGMPGTLDGGSTLTDTATGSTLSFDARIKVSIPLVGGKIEAVIADQLGQLLRAESRFTARWLENRR